MKFPATYKTRLIVYMVLLTGFLSGILLYSNKILQDALLNGGDHHLSRLVQLITAQIESKQDELMHYAAMVRENSTLQEYMFVVVRVNSDVEPLKTFYKKSFGWLPVEYNMILTKEGKLLAGKGSETITKNNNSIIHSSLSTSFAMKCEDGIEIVAYSPISYLDEQIGSIVISDDINNSSLSQLKSASGSELFIVDNGNIFTSTINNINGMNFQSDGNIFEVNGHRYHIKKITIPRLIDKNIEMWLGIREEKLMQNLASYQQTIFGLAITGSILVLVVGLVLIRDFATPLRMMMAMTAEIVSGKIPKMSKTKARNEIEGLANQFADMLQALREKEEEIQQAHKELEKLAITDTLTKLHNRRHLAEIFPKLIAQTSRDKKFINVIIFDLDHFKHINDQYGHPCGDQCLVHFANILRRHSRSNDYLFRTGGEEFLLLGISDDKTGGVQLAEKIRIATQEMPFIHSGKTIHITVSCGVNCAEPDRQSHVDFEFMLNHADKALYTAKNNGRNRVEMFCECDDDSVTEEPDFFRN